MQPVIYIAIPTRDGVVHIECMAGVLQSMARWPCTVEHAQGGVAPHNRDILTANFIRSRGTTHLLCVDSDVAWTGEDLEKLLELDVDFAFGTYTSKRIGGPTLRRGQIGSSHRDGYALEEWERCAAGFVLLKREAVQMMWNAGIAADLDYRDGSGNELVALWQTPGFIERIENVQVGEDIIAKKVRVQETDDYAFCRRWRDLGGRIFTRSDVQLGHVGHHIYRRAP